MHMTETKRRKYLDNAKYALIYALYSERNVNCPTIDQVAAEQWKQEALRCFHTDVAFNGKVRVAFEEMVRNITAYSTKQEEPTPMSLAELETVLKSGGLLKPDPTKV